MKRLALAFSILLILILYTWFAEKFVLNFCKEIDTMLETCATEILEEKYSQAMSTVSNLYDSWEENDILMSILIGDSSVVEPQKSIVAIYMSFKDENYDECLVTIRECQGYVHEIIESNRTSFGNVL